MTNRYNKRHYEDVARILGFTIRISSNCDHPDCGCKVELPAIAKDFANLFAADNPPTCNIDRCGAHPGDDTSAGHCFEDGFNRARFLTACGLEEETS